MITITKEINLQDFETWSGATDTINELTHDELETVQDNITEIYSDGLTETELNDILWFERDMIADWLGYNDFDEIIER